MAGPRPGDQSVEVREAQPRAGRGGGTAETGRERTGAPETPRPPPGRTEPGRELILAGRIRSLHPPDPGDDEPVAIPLSTAEKCVFASENCPVTVKNIFDISALNVIWPIRATAEIG